MRRAFDTQYRVFCGILFINLTGILYKQTKERFFLRNSYANKLWLKIVSRNQFCINKEKMHRNVSYTSFKCTEDVWLAKISQRYQDWVLNVENLSFNKFGCGICAERICRGFLSVRKVFENSLIAQFSKNPNPSQLLYINRVLTLLSKMRTKIGDLLQWKWETYHR